MDEVGILRNPLTNRGAGFTLEQRRQLSIEGALPAGILSVEDQVALAYESYRHLHNDIDKHLFLRAIQDFNEYLFYQLLSEHLEEMAPIIYTPVVGRVCQLYSRLPIRPRGLFLCYRDRDRLDQIVQNWPQENVRVAVVTDGERVLGLGDLGMGGMGISVGKLALYTLLGGIDPAHTLPIHLDTGTNNRQLLDDPYYTGWKHERIRGQEYDDFVEQFVQAIYRRYPDLLLQFEDFAKDNARRLLERYKNRFCCFNDDIEGTAAVTLAAIETAAKVAGIPLQQQDIAILGAGSAGSGIAELLVSVMIAQGVEESKAREKIWIFNSKGLINSTQAHLAASVSGFCQSQAVCERFGLTPGLPNPIQEVVSKVRPAILIGVSGQPGAFTRELITTMGQCHKRPIIFPLSNPTSMSEAVPEDIIEWTQGRALIATGSPFPGVHYNGKNIAIAQCNNALIFPGLGRGVLERGAKHVTQAMFIAAANTLSNYTSRHGEAQSILPTISQASLIAKEIADAVAKAVFV